LRFEMIEKKATLCGDYSFNSLYWDSNQAFLQESLKSIALSILFIEILVEKGMEGENKTMLSILFIEILLGVAPAPFPRTAFNSLYWDSQGLHLSSP